MGNYISCIVSTPAGKHSTRATKVILPGGEIQQFQTPVKAAELMLDNPNFFLVNAQSLHIGRRFSALNADQDLEMANVYVMFHMKRRNSVISAADMGALFLTANSAAKRVSGGKQVRVSPESGGVARIMAAPPGENWREDDDEVVAAPKLNLDDIEEFSTPEFKHRLSMCRSKKPLLETIAEEPVRSG